MQLKKNPQIDVIDKESGNLEKFSEKFFPSEKQPNKKSKSGRGLLLRMILFYFPLGLILYAIALPTSYCGDSPRIKQSEGKQYVGSMNRAQQAYFAENGRFANSINALGIGIKTETTNYKYSVNVAKQAAFHYGLSKDKTLRSYVGAAFLVPSNKRVPQAGENEIETVAILCVAKSSGMAKPANPTNIDGQLACGDGTEIVTK